MRKEIDIDKAIRMYRDERRPSPEVAKAVGCAVQTLIQRLGQYGVEIRSCGNHMEKCSIKQMRHEYETLKMSTPDIAKKHNMNAVSVWERLQRAGVKLRDRKEEMLKKTTKIPISKHPEICKKYLDNPTFSSADIAREYGVHKTTIMAILRKGGIRLESHGPRAGNWQGGITPLHTKIRHCEKSVEWRKQCMDRDGFKCQITGGQGSLQVHHRKSFSEIFNQFLELHSDIAQSDLQRDEKDKQLLELAQDFEPFWDLDNGITILKSTHQELHAKLYDPVFALEIQKLKNEGWNTHQISKHLGRDWHTINRILKLIETSSYSRK